MIADRKGTPVHSFLDKDQYKEIYVVLDDLILAVLRAEICLLTLVQVSCPKVPLMDMTDFKVVICVYSNRNLWGKKYLSAQLVSVVAYLGHKMALFVYSYCFVLKKNFNYTNKKIIKK